MLIELFILFRRNYYVLQLLIKIILNRYYFWYGYLGKDDFYNFVCVYLKYRKIYLVKNRFLHYLKVVVYYGRKTVRESFLTTNLINRFRI